MLTSKILLRRNASSYLKWSYASARRFTQAAEESDDLMLNLDVRLAPLPKKKPQRGPFVKNLFLGDYDNQILAYPEVQSNERQNQFNEWLKPIENCVDRNFDPKETDENILPFEAIEQLRELAVFRAFLSEENKGIGLSATEYANLFEILAKNPSLATYVASRTDPIEMLLKFGSEEQQKRYLPRFLSGELIPTFAILENIPEESTGIINTSAVGTQCRKYWKINGEKIFVSNANQANCFIILANCTETDDPLHKPQAPAIFIAEREHGGISSSNAVEKLGQKGLEACSVTFKDTLVPRDNIIGKIGNGPNVMINLLTMGKQNVGAQAATILKRFINALTQHAISKRHHDKQLMDYDYTHEIIGKMSTALYTIESMTYLTTGLIDEYEDQDVAVECAIVEAYSSKECVSQIFEGLHLLGKESYVKDSPYESIYRDALALSMFNSSQLDLHTYIAIMGLQHVSVGTYEKVQKYRNPFQFPKFMIKEVFSSKDGPDLAIEEHLHPSLQVSAKLVQKCVYLLNESTMRMLITHGSKVSDAQMELRRLAEMAIDIYAMTAALARSSRSYCIGLKHAKDDIIIAHAVCFNGYNRVEMNHKDIDVGDTQNCDDIYRSISRRVLQQKRYFAEHPLKKNF